MVDPIAVARQLPGGRQVSMPSIYAIEISSACDMRCPHCLRTSDPVPAKLFDVELLGEMIDRGDFSGTSYVELQMAGEPTLHPKLPEIVLLLKRRARVLVGMSTHGQRLRDANVADTMRYLDHLTISVDTIYDNDYAAMRPPYNLHDLTIGLTNLYAAYRQARATTGGTFPLVELQFLGPSTAYPNNTPLTGDDIAQWMHAREYANFATWRVIQDSFAPMQKRNTLVQFGARVLSTMPCQNLWRSVNVMSDGQVVSCCYVFNARSSGSPHYYGSLLTQSLAEIWHCSEALSSIRDRHMTRQFSGLECATCTYPSPVSIHDGIVRRIVFDHFKPCQ